MYKQEKYIIIATSRKFNIRYTMNTTRRKRS